MWVWDRSIGLWLWGVFQPNQEIKCLFAQLDRPTTNQSNVVCDYSSGGSLACFCVYWTKKCRMSPAEGSVSKEVVHGGFLITILSLFILSSPPWQFDWSGWLSYQHNFSSTERCQTELPQQTMLWAGLSSSGIQARFFLQSLSFSQYSV